jgi:Tat protein translocase TatB subunit
MFGIGIPELIIILIVALLVVGPSKLPELARSMGKALGEFRKLADDVKDTIEQEMAKEPETEDRTQKVEQTEEQQKVEETPIADGHMVVEEGSMQDMTQEQRVEAEMPPEAEVRPQQDRLFAEEELTPEEKAQKIAEGIRVNEQQKT